MKKRILFTVLAFALPFMMRAQLAAVGYVEYGYAMLNYKTDELPVFLNAYNGYYANIKTPFETKIGMAKGTYVKFGFGFGGEICKMTLDFTIYEAKTKPLEVRFSDGSGRDLWAEHRFSNTDIGIRFGGSQKYPMYAQFDMDIGIQTTSLYCAYVYQDGSQSLGLDKDLNGVYSNFVMAGGIGATIGYRIIGPLAINLSANYIGNFERKHPEYHQFEDLNDVKPVDTPDYLPRDIGEYIAEPWNMSGNSISNDFRGWKFTFGVVAMIGGWKEN